MIVSSSNEADRVLYLSPTDPASPPGGREMLSRTNLAILRDLFGDSLEHVRVVPKAPSVAGALRGHVDGIDAKTIDTLVAHIRNRRIGRVFVDGSNLGAATAAIKRRLPEVRVVTFFHNVEARFFWGSFRIRRSPKAAAVLLANWIAERAAVRWSDVVVCLNRRDSEGLKRLYGRGADAIAPIVLEDKYPAVTPSPLPGLPRYILFVGGAFYANIAGIRWFAREVAPRIGLHTMVVGRGMETLAEEFAGNDAVTFVGEVDDLSRWYAGAVVAIAPIFDGSGMKTKVAEALIFGKRVVGTAEAFMGYADDVVASNWRCEDANAFVVAIRDVSDRPPPAWDAVARRFYERDHAPCTARERLGQVLGMADRAIVA